MTATRISITRFLLTATFALLGYASSVHAACPFDLFDRHGDACCDSREADCSDSSCCNSKCDISCDCGATGCDGVGCDSIACRLKDPCCYGSVFGGWSSLNSYSGLLDFPPPPAPAPPRLHGTFNDGWAIGMAAGRRLGSSLRGEAEFAFRSNTADKWSVNGATNDWSGHGYGYSLMGNLVYDFHCRSIGITPYIGGGIGLLVVDGDFSTPATEFRVQDEAFAYQLIAGTAVPVLRNVDLFGEYRFFGSTDLQLKNVGVVPNIEVGDFRAEANNLFFGIRVHH